MRKFIVLILIFLYPILVSADTEGFASWYGGGEKLNTHTANGEAFDPTQLTCASWYYPFGTKLEVINLINGKRVIVRVNDRGPNKKLGRAIDLTKYAFSQIADLSEGLVRVRITTYGDRSFRAVED